MTLAGAAMTWPVPRTGPDGELVLDVPHGMTSTVVRDLATGALPMPPYVVRPFRPLPDVPPGERAITVDQTNRSVIVGETVVVKWFTRPRRGRHRAPDLLEHLASLDAAATETATPYAVLEWDGALIALVTGYLPGARDGWEWCVDEAAAGHTRFATDLGRLSARLHLALATPSHVFADAVRPYAGDGSLSRRAETALGVALRVTDGEDGEWLARHEPELRSGLSPLAGVGGTPTIRIHQDLHLGQILKWDGGYSVIDFDGNPTIHDADPFQPAARDLAQLSTSLAHAGQVAIRRRGSDPVATNEWVTLSRRALEESHAAELATAGRAELLDRSLLRPFEIEQECRELVYAATHLPRWRYAPMGVLRTWFGE